MLGQEITAKILFLTAVFVAILLTFACDNRSFRIIPLENITLDQTEITLNVNETKQLNVIYTPENATDKKVVWATSDSTIAVVSDEGEVMGISEGDVIVSVTTIDTLHNSECKVFVFPDDSFLIRNKDQWDEAISFIKEDHDNITYRIIILDDVSLPGTESNTFGDRTDIEVTISGNYTISLDIDTTGHLIKIDNAQKLILDNIALKGHLNNNASLVNIYGLNTTLSIQGYASISENRTINLGGGIYSDRGTVNISDFAKIHNNSAIRGGGIYTISGMLSMKNFASIRNNKANGAGGIWALNSSVVLSDYVSISQNMAIGTTMFEGCGGGVYYSGNHFMMSDNVSIFENIASGDGGGIYNSVFSRDRLIISGNSSIYGNTAMKGGGICGGATIKEHGSIY